MTAFQADFLKEATRWIIFMLLAFQCTVSSKGNSFTFSIVLQWVLVGLHARTELTDAETDAETKNCASNSSMATVRGQVCCACPRKIPSLPRYSEHPRISIMLGISFQKGPTPERRWAGLLRQNEKSDRREKSKRLLCPNGIAPQFQNCPYGTEIGYKHLLNELNWQTLWNISFYLSSDFHVKKRC